MYIYVCIHIYMYIKFNWYSLLVFPIGYSLLYRAFPVERYRIQKKLELVRKSFKICFTSAIYVYINVRMYKTLEESLSDANSRVRAPTSRTPKYCALRPLSMCHGHTSGYYTKPRNIIQRYKRLHIF